MRTGFLLLCGKNRAGVHFFGAVEQFCSERGKWTGDAAAARKERQTRLRPVIMARTRFSR